MFDIVDTNHLVKPSDTFTCTVIITPAFNIKATVVTLLYFFRLKFPGWFFLLQSIFKDKIRACHHLLLDISDSRGGSIVAIMSSVILGGFTCSRKKGESAVILLAPTNWSIICIWVVRRIQCHMSSDVKEHFCIWITTEQNSHWQVSTNMWC